MLLLELIYYFTYFSTFSTGLVGVVLTTKDLQEKHTTVGWDGGGKIGKIINKF